MFCKLVKYRDRSGEYRFRLVARNGRKLPDGYKRRRDRDRIIEKLFGPLIVLGEIKVVEDR